MPLGELYHADFRHAGPVKSCVVMINGTATRPAFEMSAVSYCFHRSTTLCDAGHILRVQIDPHSQQNAGRFLLLTPVTRRSE